MLFNDSINKYRSTSSSFRPATTGRQFRSTTITFGQNLNSRQSVRTRSFGSIKNSQKKLDNLKQELIYIHKDVLAVRETTKETSLFLKFMKEDLRDRMLPQIQDDLKKQLVALRKSLNIGDRSDKLRYDAIKENITQLQKGNKGIQQQLFTLKDRMDRIEDSLGFYSGCEKHRF